MDLRNNSQLNGLNAPNVPLVLDKCTKDVYDLTRIGHRIHAVGATALNERSIRSHSYMCVQDVDGSLVPVGKSPQLEPAFTSNYQVPSKQMRISIRASKSSEDVKKRRQGKKVTAIDNYDIAHYCEKKEKMVSEEAAAVLVCSATMYFV
ncbi:kinesin-like protein KIN-14F [Tanacetum coccineum]